VRRRLLNGVLGGLAAVAALYAIGTIGLLAERQMGRGGMNPAFAYLGLVVAAGFGFFVLQRLSRSKDSPTPPTKSGPATSDQPGDVNQSDGR
jgi:hypothetical protein